MENNNKVNFDVFRGVMGVSMFLLDENGNAIDTRVGFGCFDAPGDLRKHISFILNCDSGKGEDIDSDEVRLGEYYTMLHKNVGNYGEGRNRFPVIKCRDGVCKLTGEFFGFDLPKALGVSYDGLWAALDSGITELWAALDFAENYVYEEEDDLEMI